MNEFLGFVDMVGRTIDGGYIYRFDFTLDADVVNLYREKYEAGTPNLKDKQKTPNKPSHFGVL